MATLATRLTDWVTQVGTDYKLIMGKFGDLASLNTTVKTSIVAAINEVNSKPTGGSISDTDPGTSPSVTYSAQKITSLLSGKADDTLVAKLAGTQTFTGSKTFAVSPGVPDGSWTIAKTSGLQAALDAKPVINDASATTATATTYSANKINAAIAAAISSLVNGAGTALDTLNELAAALGNDANFATNTATALGNRVRYDAAQTLTAPQQAQARANIGALSTAEIGNPDTDFVALYTAAKA